MKLEDLEETSGFLSFHLGKYSQTLLRDVQQATSCLSVDKSPSDKRNQSREGENGCLNSRV